MANWAQRMHRRAADIGNVVTSCGHPGPGPYPHRLEKVKFGISLDEVCKNDIPGPLLILILKLNKEAPLRKDIFRAPGNQNSIKKLIHFLQQGRLVNVDNYSVYTIASVLKTFLRKLPNGIFGRDGESELFMIFNLNDEHEKQIKINRLITSLPIYTQRLLVLLFGTFRVIASNAERADTGMTSEALGVSVAPSFFQSCVSDGKTARMEDVLRFKVATKIMKQIIDQFATYDLFGRDNYEYYARITGRILKVQDEWICNFRYPPLPRGKSAQQNYAAQFSLEAEKTWLQCECERWGLKHSLLQSCARLSVSLEGSGVYPPITSTQSSKIHKNNSCSINLNGNNGNNGGSNFSDDDSRNNDGDGDNDENGSKDGDDGGGGGGGSDNSRNDNTDDNDGNNGDDHTDHHGSGSGDCAGGGGGGCGSNGNGNNSSEDENDNEQNKNWKLKRENDKKDGNRQQYCHNHNHNHHYYFHHNHHHHHYYNHRPTMRDLRNNVNRYSEKTRSLSYLPQLRSYCSILNYDDIIAGDGLLS